MSNCETSQMASYVGGMGDSSQKPLTEFYNRLNYLQTDAKAFSTANMSFIKHCLCAAFNTYGRYICIRSFFAYCLFLKMIISIHVHICTNGFLGKRH